MQGNHTARSNPAMMTLPDFRASVRERTPEEASELFCTDINDLLSSPVSTVLVYASGGWIERLTSGACHVTLGLDEQFGDQSDMEAALYDYLAVEAPEVLA
jgi:hypothetical protein